MFFFFYAVLPLAALALLALFFFIGWYTTKVAFSEPDRSEDLYNGDGGFGLK